VNRSAGVKVSMLSVVVLNYRNAELALDGIRCLPEAVGTGSYELIVVDNASGDGSAAYMRESLPWARVIETPSNAGFAAGMNAGLRQANGDYVLIMNSDVRPGAGSVETLLAYMRGHPDVGIAAPLLVDESGRTSRTLLIQPTIWRAFVPLLAKLRYKRWCDRLDVCPLAVEACEGAAAIVTRQAIERAGLLDESFFFYYEIVEWCMRIRQSGLSVVIVPSAKMTHLGGQSTANRHLAAQVELKRSEYLLLRKLFGRAVWCAAVTRDTFSEALRTLFYAALARSAGRRRTRSLEKLAAHAAVLRWLLRGMPTRDSAWYKNVLGAWE